MKTYLITYHASEEAMASTKSTPPEESKEHMKAWMAWSEQCGDYLVDFGQPVGRSQALTNNGSLQPSNREICGYSKMKAKDEVHLKQLLTGHPHLSGWDDSCAIEFHEILPIPEA